MSDEKKAIPDPLVALFDLVSGSVFDAPKKKAPAPAEQPTEQPKVKPDGKKRSSKPAVVVNVGDVWKREPKPGARAGAPAGAKKAGKAPEESGDDNADE